MFSKTEGNTYATLLHHPFLFGENQRGAQEVARRISGAVAGKVYAKVNIPSTHHIKFHILAFTLLVICLSFSSPPLLKRFYKNYKNIYFIFCLVYLSLSYLTFASDREGIDNPFIALGASCLLVCVDVGDLRVVSYWIDTLVL